VGVGGVLRWGERENTYRFMVGKPEGKRKLGRPKPRPSYSNEVDVIGIGWEGRT
jgi:hypothetical protein